MRSKKKDRFISLLFLKDKPLSTQLAVLSTLLVIIPMLMVGLMSYLWSSSILEDESLGYNLEVLDQVKTHIEYYLRDFSRSSIKLLNNQDMMTFLRIVASGQSVTQEDINTAKKVMHENMFLTSEISNISLVINHFGTINALERYDTPQINVLKEPWYLYLQKNNEYAVFATRFVSVNNKPEPVISVIKKVVNPQTLDEIGVLVIDINYRRLQEIAQKFNVSNRTFYIIDSGGRYIYHPNREMIGSIAGYHLLEAVNTGHSETLLAMGEERQYAIVTDSAQLDWKFIVTTPYEEIQKNIISLGKTIAWIVVITLIIAYLLGLIYLGTIINPLRHLQRLMKEVEVGKLDGKVAVNSRDEIGELSYGFNKMVIRLAELVEEVYFSRIREAEAQLSQREMEMQVLQAQVNPHFVGNALETIRGMALERGFKDIANMACSLGLLLRYNLRQGAAIVTLKEELTYLKFYYEIQRYRFGEIVACEFMVPEWALEQEIVKFSLQPLMENCYRHGINLKRKYMKIIIKAEKDTDDGFYLHISDTGNGMSREMLGIVRGRLKGEQASCSKHIGILNVHRRICHLFGNGYGVSIGSLPGGGTRVSLYLPINNKGEE